MIHRAVGRAVATLRMNMYRLGEVIADVEDDEWVVREMLFQCRATLNEQMEKLVRFRKRLMRNEMGR